MSRSGSIMWLPATPVSMHSAGVPRGTAVMRRVGHIDQADYVLAVVDPVRRSPRAAIGAAAVQITGATVPVLEAAGGVV